MNGENENNNNFVFNEKYPYICKIIDSGREFIPTQIHYDLQEVWIQTGQSFGSGEWISFEDVIFKENKNFIGIQPV